VRPIGRVIALLCAGLASGAALMVQNLARNVWQIRTLPERVMEWLLLFVPLDLFERGIGQFGGEAKELALVGTVVGMAVLLVLIGTLALWRGASAVALYALGLVLWLLAMAVVMPVTGAGFFASGLLVSPLLTGSAFLLMFLVYSSVLVGGRLLAGTLGQASVGSSLSVERRALVFGLMAAITSGVVARFVGREGGLVSSDLPLASVPTRQPNVAASAASVAAAAPEQLTPPPQANTAATPQPAPSGPNAAPPPTPAPTAETLPTPPPARQIARDKDGSLTAAGRPKGQLAPTITANEDFYIVTKNAVADPVVDPTSWRLILDGEVNKPVQLDYRTLRALPAVDMTKTLECISNFTAGCSLTASGCDLLSTARWRGVRLSDVLDLAGGLKPSAVALAVMSVDEFSASLPPDITSDPQAIIVYEMNGQPLPREHGYPARLLVPGRYGMKSPKWLAGIRAMSQPYVDWYAQRNWSPEGIVKTMSRIDVPLDGATLPAGPQRVAGISYAGDRGISLVEISTDGGGRWQTCSFIEPMADRDTMVRWQTTVLLGSGEQVTITVRATDGTGEVQTDDFQLPQPNGGSGRDEITVTGA
jgi:DMSO/TMAO reductase YedYZ molybdopterin-dependent catalytic subunit